MHILSWNATADRKSVDELIALWFEAPPPPNYCLIVQSLGALLTEPICSKYPPGTLIVLSGPVCSNEFPFWLRPAIRWATRTPRRANILHRAAVMLAQSAASLRFDRWEKSLNQIHPETYSALFFAAVRCPKNRFIELEARGCLHRIFDPKDRLSGIPKYGILNKWNNAGHLIENQTPKELTTLFRGLLFEDEVAAI